MPYLESAPHIMHAVDAAEFNASFTAFETDTNNDGSRLGMMVLRSAAGDETTLFMPRGRSGDALPGLLSEHPEWSPRVIEDGFRLGFYSDIATYQQEYEK